jgi:hypothetical protein
VLLWLSEYVELTSETDRTSLKVIPPINTYTIINLFHKSSSEFTFYHQCEVILNSKKAERRISEEARSKIHGTYNSPAISKALSGARSPSATDNGSSNDTPREVIEMVFTGGWSSQPHPLNAPADSDAPLI